MLLNPQAELQQPQGSQTRQRLPAAAACRLLLLPAQAPVPCVPAVLRSPAHPPGAACWPQAPPSGWQSCICKQQLMSNEQRSSITVGSTSRTAWAACSVQLKPISPVWRAHGPDGHKQQSCMPAQSSSLPSLVQDELTTPQNSHQFACCTT